MLFYDLMPQLCHCRINICLFRGEIFQEAAVMASKCHTSHKLWIGRAFWSKSFVRGDGCLLQCMPTKILKFIFNWARATDIEVKWKLIRKWVRRAMHKQIRIHTETTANAYIYQWDLIYRECVRSTWYITPRRLRNPTKNRTRFTHTLCFIAKC